MPEILACHRCMSISVHFFVILATKALVSSRLISGSIGCLKQLQKLMAFILLQKLNLFALVSVIFLAGSYFHLD